MRPILLLAVATALAVTATVARSEPGGAQATRTVTIGVYAGAISLDPENTNDNLTYSIEREVYDGLVGIAPDLKFVPELATSWDVSPDARVYTFHLRPGVTFQDGTPLDAAAVKLNFDRARNPVNKLIRRNLYENIASVDVVDPSTVRFTLDQPFGAMMYNFSHPASRIISPTPIAKGESFIARQAVGTGAVQVRELGAGPADRARAESRVLDSRRAKGRSARVQACDRRRHPGGDAVERRRAVCVHGAGRPSGGVVARGRRYPAQTLERLRLLHRAQQPTRPLR